jgi:hypothetical protein
MEAIIAGIVQRMLILNFFRQEKMSLINRDED